MTLATMAWLPTVAKVLQLLEAKKKNICIKNSNDRLVSELLARLGQIHCTDHMPHVGHMQACIGDPGKEHLACPHCLSTPLTS